MRGGGEGASRGIRVKGVAAARLERSGKMVVLRILDGWECGEVNGG